MSIDQEVSFQSAFSTHTQTWRLRCQCPGRELNRLQKVSVCAKLFTRLTEQTGGMEQNDKHNLCCFPVGFSFRACPVTGEIDFLEEIDTLSCTSVSCGFCGSRRPWLCPAFANHFFFGLTYSWVHRPMAFPGTTVRLRSGSMVSSGVTWPFSEMRVC